MARETVLARTAIALDTCIATRRRSTVFKVGDKVQHSPSGRTGEIVDTIPDGNDVGVRFSGVSVTYNVYDSSELRLIDESNTCADQSFGAAKYLVAGENLGKLVQSKQAAYGNSFGKSGDIMRILYPSGIPADKLDDALTIVRVIDKLFRVATDNDPSGESPWKDIAGYALLASERTK
jgi:hypothetical protein